MPLTDIDVKRLPIKESRYKKTVGDGLYVVVEAIKNKKSSGGKSFVGVMRFLPSIFHYQKCRIYI